MKVRPLLPFVAVLLAVFAFPTGVLAQFARNTNQSRKLKSVLVGGSGNLIESNSIASIIGGGQSNIVSRGVANAVIGGGYLNTASGFGYYATVAGGYSNTASGHTAATVSGGYANTASSDSATVGGGSFNTASGFSAVVCGGHNNSAISGNAAVGGGSYNNAGATATVAGGYNNVASGEYATVGGGRDNVAGGSSSCIPGGAYNFATNFSFAAGYRSTALHGYSFVWSDGQNFESFGTNTFNVRASGGFYLDNGTSIYFGNATRQMINLYNQNYAIGVQTGAEYFRTGNRFYWYLDGSHTNAIGNPGAGGSVLMVLDTAGLTVNGTFVSTSDRNVKQNIRPLDAKAVLQKVASLPVSEWSYKASPDALHYGPMAQDFRAAFGVGTDDKTISMVDADGVALASIKGLVEELKERDKAIGELKAENKELFRSIEKINERLSSLPPRP